MSRPSAFFLTPEQPGLCGGGAIRSASLLEYLLQKYDVDVAGFQLPHHSYTTAARAARNALRLVRHRPPLFDRYSGFADQVRAQMHGHYRVAIVEHFWCASYAEVLRPHADLLVLDLHNIESQLARSHAQATTGIEAAAFARFARAYEKLERQWLPCFDLVLVTSKQDATRITNFMDPAKICVYPNALPEMSVPLETEADCIVFSGNLEYHPNVEAVRWFHQHVWPGLRQQFPSLVWRLVGRNPQAIERIIAGDTNIQVTGEVKDAIPLIAQAKVAIVPLRSGSGTRFKILQAWAAKRAVVSTTLGAEGLGAEAGKHLWLADDAETFLHAIVGGLRSPSLRQAIGEAGHALYRERFTWPIAWQALDDNLGQSLT